MTKPDPYMAGFAAAVAAVVRLHDEPRIAADVIAGEGYSLADFRGVDPFDMRMIRPLFRNEPALKGGAS